MTRLSEVYVAKLAWITAGLGSIAVIADVSLRLLSTNLELPEGVRTEPAESLVRLATIGLLCLGGLIASKRPENRIGWLALVAGFALSVNGLAEIYAARAIVGEPGSLPFGSFFWWLFNATYGIPYGCIPVFLLLFPTGDVHSPRWRPWLRISIVLLAVEVVSGAALGVAAWDTPFPEEEGENSLTGLTGVAFGIFFFALMAILALSLMGFLSLVFRYRLAGTEQRQQLKWLALSALLMMVGLAGFFVAVSAGQSGAVLVVLGWIGVLGQLAFYAALAVAILKYRLYEIDYIINRALVYGTLTALLAGLYTASIQMFRLLFEDVTGIATAASLVTCTLVFGSIFSPVRSRLQSIVDKYFGVPAASRLAAHDERLRAVLKVFDADSVAREFLVESVETLDAQSGAVYITEGGQTRCAAEVGPWPGEERVRIPLRYEGLDVGFLSLGPARGSRQYDQRLLEGLQSSASLVARAILLASRGESMVHVPGPATGTATSFRRRWSKTAGRPSSRRGRRA